MRAAWDAVVVKMAAKEAEGEHEAALAAFNAVKSNATATGKALLAEVQSMFAGLKVAKAEAMALRTVQSALEQLAVVVVPAATANGASGANGTAAPTANVSASLGGGGGAVVAAPGSRISGVFGGAGLAIDEVRASHELREAASAALLAASKEESSPGLTGWLAAPPTETVAFLLQLENGGRMTRAYAATVLTALEAVLGADAALVRAWREQMVQGPAAAAAAVEGALKLARNAERLRGGMPPKGVATKRGGDGGGGASKRPKANTKAPTPVNPRPPTLNPQQREDVQRKAAREFAKASPALLPSRKPPAAPPKPNGRGDSGAARGASSSGHGEAVGTGAGPAAGAAAPAAGNAAEVAANAAAEAEGSPEDSTDEAAAAAGSSTAPAGANGGLAESGGGGMDLTRLEQYRVKLADGAWKMGPQWAPVPNGRLDIFHVPNFAETVLKCNATELQRELVCKYPVRRSGHTIVPGAVQWVDGDNEALKYRGNAVKRRKMWLQRGDPKKEGFRKYLYVRSPPLSVPQIVP